MDSRKRRGHNDDDTNRSRFKSARLETERSSPVQHTVTNKSNLSNASEDFQINVKLRSMSKAARNDPVATRSPRELYYETTTNIDPSNVGGFHETNLRENVTGITQGNVQPLNAREIREDDTTTEEDREQYDDESSLNEDEELSEIDEDHELEWLESIDVEATSPSNPDEHGQPGKVAYCEAKLIRRHRIREDFYQEMELPSEETSMLAFDLFDRYGRFRPEFRTHPIMKGTGVWGKELDRGDILLIEVIFVSQACRRRKLGQKMVEALLKTISQKTTSFFAFLWPTILKLGDVELEWANMRDEAARHKMADREGSRAIAFCRSLGFRRVGSTIWFAMASNHEHPSRKLTSMEDLDPPKAPLTDLDPLLRPFEQIDGPPPDYIGVLQDCLHEKGSADICWTSTNHNGNTILHLAAATFNAACVEWILNQEFGNSLLQCRNHHGETPLESLEFKLEKLRTQTSFNLLTVSMSDKFEGNSESAVRCLLLLKRLGRLETLRESGGIGIIKQAIGGCTCGQCLYGFLSPRMLHALYTQASADHDWFDLGVDDMEGPIWTRLNEDSLAYLPSKVRKNLETNKSMRKGFVNLWKYIGTCLERRIVPTERNVLQIFHEACEWPPVTRNFLSRGGSVESVFLGICKEAMEADECIGDGRYQEEFSEDIANLPECRNDLEFGFVSGSCGYRRISLIRNVDMMGNTLDENGNGIDSMA